MEVTISKAEYDDLDEILELQRSAFEYEAVLYNNNNDIIHRINTE